MSRVFLVCAVLLAACAGFLLGRSTGSGPDSQSGFLERQAERRLVSLPAEEVFELRAKGERVDLLRAENERLREELKRIAPATAEEELPPGSRREDQSIVGGARWSDNFTRLATGFLDAMIAEFIKEANLSPEQERRLMDELHVRVGQILAVTADFTNGDIDGDRAYEQLNILAEEGHKFVRGLLDDKQLETYFRFESGVKEFMQRRTATSTRRPARRSGSTCARIRPPRSTARSRRPSRHPSSSGACWCRRRSSYTRGMRRTAALVICLSAATLAAPPKAPWCAPDSDTAVEIARTRGKLIFLTVIVDNDAESRMVVDEIFRNREFLKLAKEFVCVYANPHDEHGRVKVKGPKGKKVSRCADCPSIKCEQHQALAMHWARGFFEADVKTPIHFVINQNEDVVEAIFGGDFKSGLNPVPASQLVARLKKLLVKHGRGLTEAQYKRMMEDLSDARAARARGNVTLELEKLTAVLALGREVEGVLKARKRLKEIDAIAAEELKRIEALATEKEWEAALDAIEKLCTAYPGTLTCVAAAKRKQELLKDKEVKRLLKAANLYERGMNYLKRRKLDLARKKFKDIVRSYMDTRYGPLAQKELESLGEE
ncbi:MAG: tetratricopeptide repeat protein [Planctomycetota bacterium]